MGKSKLALTKVKSEDNSVVFEINEGRVKVEERF